MELRADFSEALVSVPGTRIADDSALVEDCLAAREEAWSALVAKYKRLIYSIPLKSGIPPADAADIFQGVWVDLLEGLGRMRDASKLKPWLITVTVRKCMHFRSKQKHAHARLSQGDALEWADPNADLPGLYAMLEVEQAVREAMETLSPRCVTLIKYLFYDEPHLSYSHIARRIGVSSNAIGSLRERCLNRLRQALEDSGKIFDEELAELKANGNRSC
jgi:RNA polymerase sigma factor (sigma-70 family)